MVKLITVFEAVKGSPFLRPSSYWVGSIVGHSITKSRDRFDLSTNVSYDNGRVSKQRSFIPNLLLLAQTQFFGAIRNINHNTVYCFLWPQSQNFCLALVTLASSSRPTMWLAWPQSEHFGKHFGLSRGRGQNAEAEDNVTRTRPIKAKNLGLYVGLGLEVKF